MSSFIVVDWGTSSFRASRIVAGKVVDSVAVGKGVVRIPRGEHAAVFWKLLPEAWDEKLIFLVGMVGSTVGWVEVPYAATPVGIADLRTQCITMKDRQRTLIFVPGGSHCTATPHAAPDIMRGEETQILGAIHLTPQSTTYVCPGTHSKWARVNPLTRKITSFRTFMTGDVYAAVRDHTILVKNNITQPPGPGEVDLQWFLKGVDTEGSLLSNLFKVRAMAVARKYPQQDVTSASSSYLSGIIIGDEIRNGLRGGEDTDVTVIGNNELCSLYKIALERISKKKNIQTVSSEAAVHKTVTSLLPKPKLHKIVAILRGVTPDEVVDIGRALVESNVRCIEVPLNSPQPLESIAALVQEFKGVDNVLIGAGTVLTTQDVDRVAATGARLVVSPNTNIDVIKRTVELGMVSLPGIYTPSDAFSALSCGADGLKLFPAETITPVGLKAMKAVLPKTTKIFAVGGVTHGNMKEWTSAGAYGFGIGSGMYKPGMTAAEARERARKFMEAAKL